MAQVFRGERRVFRPADYPESIKRRSGMIEAFYGCEPSPAPIVVVQHIRKTAGTSLRQVVRANVLPAEVEVARDQRSSLFEPAELREWYGGWYWSLDADRRARLRCVMSHSAGFLLSSLDRPAVALGLVREPVDRILSFWEYKRAISESRRERGRKYRTVVPLEDIYSSAGAAGVTWPAQYFNGQSRVLLAMFHDVADFPSSAGSSPDAEVWRARVRDLVERDFFAGVHDRFPEYVQLLARRFGWLAFVPTGKVNPARRPLSELPVGLRETIRAHNWLDAELHALCRRIQERREAEARLSRQDAG